MMTTADVDTRKKRQPFVPIRIVTESGESFEVRDPQMLMVGVRDILVGFPTQRHSGICERIERVHLADIVTIDDLPESAESQSSNGNAGGR